MILGQELKAHIDKKKKLQDIEKIGRKVNESNEIWENACEYIDSKLGYNK